MKAQIKVDFPDMGITEFYMGRYNDFAENTVLDKQLEPIYNRAEQVISISSGNTGQQYERFLSPDAVVKHIHEHDRTDLIAWKLNSGRPALNASLGLNNGALGIKIAEVKK